MTWADAIRFTEQFKSYSSTDAQIALSVLVAQMREREISELRTRVQPLSDDTCSCGDCQRLPQRSAQ